jgi:hypothetical protein
LSESAKTTILCDRRQLFMHAYNVLHALTLQWLLFNGSSVRHTLAMQVSVEHARQTTITWRF